jgi:N-methylhydantoinase A
MERAIRTVSLARGHDPADFALLAFGGAGGLHAASLAASLGMPLTMVPPDPGSLSARGMASADVVQDGSAALLVPLSPATLRALRAARDALVARLHRSRAAEGFPAPRFATALDLRYRGQSFEIEVPAGEDLDPGAARAAFEEAHERLYHARHPAREVEAVAVRVTATGAVGAPAERPVPRGGADPGRAHDGTRRADFGRGEEPAPFFDRGRLRAGNVIPGPAVVTEPTGTTVVPPGHAARVDRLGNLLVERTRR